MSAVHAWYPTGPGDAPLARLDLAGGRASINQRQLRRVGLAGWQAATTTALLTAWDLAPGDGAFFDVGANAGVYALLCRLLHPETRAVAFEPFPASVEAGRRWAQANGIDPCFEQVAVSDEEGTGTLHVSSQSDATNSLVAGFRDTAETIEVPLVTLDGYVARTGTAPAVVKIDVEQHEPAVVDGASDVLAEHRPVVVMELLGSPTSREADQRLRRLGYQTLDLAGRDRLYWPGARPPGFAERLDGWQRAVARCVPDARPARWRRRLGLARRASAARTTGGRRATRRAPRTGDGADG